MNHPFLPDDLPARQPWHTRAWCVSHPNPDLWFPKQSTRPGVRDNDAIARRYARNLCGPCPVRDDCLAHALTSPIHEHGVWGGMTEQDRRALRANIGLTTRYHNPIYPLCGSEAGSKVHQRRGEPPCPACRRAQLAARANRKNTA